MFNDMEMFMGNESYMSASLVNKGKTTVYNVTAELVSDTLTAYDVEFLGNIMPGSTASAEFDFTASQVGTSNGKLVVTYEDASGTQYTLERDFSIEVMEEMVWDEPVVDMPAVEPAVPKTSFVPYIIGGAVIVAAGGFFFWKKKKNAKRKAELEDEDEDI
jgi:LPXTG-motif cell wall-anchored protein